MSEHTPESSQEDVSRREFLIRGGTTAAVAGAAGLLSWRLYDSTGKAGLLQPAPERLKNYFAGIDYPVDAPRISIARGKSEKLESMLRAALIGLDERGMSRFVSNNDTVLLKPNVGFERAPAMGATTNPEVLRFVMREVFAAGAKRVIVADGPIEEPAACFARSHIGRVAREEGATVILPANVHYKPIQVRPTAPDPVKHEALGTWPIFWTPLRDADKVISVVPIKDHNLCYASMSMKNWYGLLGGRRNQFHQAIHNIVSDLGFMMSPTLVIIDGTRVMMRNGPTGGSLDDVREANTVVASVDQLACDAWCYQHLLGRDPAALRYLDLAYDKFGGRDYAQAKRFGERDWSAYKAQGKIVETNVT